MNENIPLNPEASELETKTLPEVLPSAAMDAWIQTLKPYPDRPSIGELLNQIPDTDPEAEAKKAWQMTKARELLASLLDDIKTEVTEIQHWWQTATPFEVEARVDKHKTELYDLIALSFESSTEALILKLKADRARTKQGFSASKPDQAA